jgi:cytidylate kinase
MTKKKITVALDGHASTGKSTLAKAIAKTLGYTYIDSGAMYRAVAYFVLQNKLTNPDGLPDADALASKIDTLQIDFRPISGMETPVIHLNGQCIESEIRNMEVSKMVSEVAVLGFVRRALVRQQQEMGKSGGVVMDGRDIGTVVFPNAELKIYMTASPEIRAQRRFAELEAKGQQVTFEEILQNVNHRDHLDATRAESPLKPASDSRLLDNSHMSREEQLDIALAWAKEVMHK